ncbi:PREDICTED: uncharacterized protein LOC108763172, partial [Trachymyrmex cornetzi]|uniref:uncharacterized protein LOC108763172 n=1 Tax=Trachymyrmex cornetzi TaxID=471704 RepID=UPI00084F79DA
MASTKDKEHTKAALEKKLNKRRVPVPKLTMSTVHDNDKSLLSEEEENEISDIVKRRKINQERCNKSRKETNTSIIAAYVSASNKQQSLQLSAADKSEESNISDNEEDSSNNLLKEKQKELDECLQKLMHAEDRAKFWEEQYNTLQESGNYNLTEKTGKNIITILETISNRTHDDNDYNASKNEKSSVKEQTINIGND